MQVIFYVNSSQIILAGGIGGISRHHAYAFLYSRPLKKVDIG
jgi:hypothetical protein